MSDTSRNIFVALMTIVFIAGMFTMLSRDLLASNIIQAINADFHAESGNKRYINNFWQGGNFSIKYGKDKIKVVRSSTFSKNICADVHLNIDSDIVDISESERFIKEKCNKFEDLNFFIVTTKFMMEEETESVSMTREE